MLETETIGIRFEISREYLNHFAQLFENFPVEKYTWYVSCSENYSSSNGKIHRFLPNGIYSGDEFSTIIHSELKYYIHLIVLFAVPTGDAFDTNIIDSYADYIKSNAEIALLSADSFVDLYIKDHNALKNIFTSCNKYYSNGAIPLEWSTSKNDGREKFKV